MISQKTKELQALINQLKDKIQLRKVIEKKQSQRYQAVHMRYNISDQSSQSEFTEQSSKFDFKSRENNQLEESLLNKNLLQKFNQNNELNSDGEDKDKDSGYRRRGRVERDRDRDDRDDKNENYIILTKIMQQQKKIQQSQNKIINQKNYQIKELQQNIEQLQQIIQINKIQIIKSDKIQLNPHVQIQLKHIIYQNNFQKNYKYKPFFIKLNKSHKCYYSSIKNGIFKGFYSKFMFTCKSSEEFFNENITMQIWSILNFKNTLIGVGQISKQNIFLKKYSLKLSIRILEGQSKLIVQNGLNQINGFKVVGTISYTLTFKKPNVKLQQKQEQ